MKTAIHLAATLAIVLFVCVPPGLASQVSRDKTEFTTPTEQVKAPPTLTLGERNKNGPDIAQTGDASANDAAASPDSSQNVGDINLNGVPNEVADAVLYSKYFVYGLQVFRVDQPAQVMETDTNADGMPLSVSDFVYQINVINLGK